MELTYNRYEYDLGRLVQAVEKLAKPPAAAATPSPESSAGRETFGTSAHPYPVAPTRPPAAGSEPVDQLLSQADAALGQGHKEEALRDFNRALELEPNNAFALEQRKMLPGRFRRGLQSFAVVGE